MGPCCGACDYRCGVLAVTNPSNMALSFPIERGVSGQLAGGTIKVTIKVQPEDMPLEFLQAAPGSKWTMAVVRQDEEGQLIAPSQPEDKKVKKEFWDLPTVQQAGMLCKDYQFQNWVNGWSEKIITDESSCAIAIRTFCKVETRKNLTKENPEWKVITGKWREHVEEQRYGDNLR